MKTINYCGELYHVPKWANYVTSDDSGVYAWVDEPEWDSKVEFYFVEGDEAMFEVIDLPHPVTGKMKV